MKQKYNYGSLSVKLPTELTDAVKIACRKRLASQAQYVRESLLEKLERDGIDVDRKVKPAA